MAWAGSSMFRQWNADCLTRTQTSLNFATDVPKVALYDNTITPDNDVTAVNSAYAGGVWSATGGGTGTPQVYQAGQWAQGGVALSGATGTTNFTGTADAIWYDATDTASGAAATISNIVGCLVYDDTLSAPVGDQGICYNYFGGAQGVSAGTFTVVWHANGIWRINSAQA